MNAVRQRLSRATSWAAAHPSPTALAGIACLVFALFGPALLRGEVFYYRDIHLQWIGQAESLVRSVTAGSWPVWDRRWSFGQPLLANPNNQIFYPPTWLNFLMPPWHYYSVLVVGHFVLAGAGFFLAARRLGASDLAAFVGAACWVTSGPFVSLVSLWNHLAGAAFLPWAVWAADRALTSGSGSRTLAWGAIVAAPVLCGSPETTLMGVAATFPVLVRHFGEVPARRMATTLALALAAGAVFSAAQWWPTLELVGRSVRSHYPTSQGGFWSVPPLGLFQLVTPVWLDALPLQRAVRVALFEGREPFLSSLYLGVTTVLFVAAAVSARTRVTAATAVLAAVSLLMALGRHGGLYAVVTAVIPAAQGLRFPAKGFVLMSFAWALLVAFGLDAYARRTARKVRVPEVVTALSMVCLFAVAALAWLGSDTWGALLVAPDYTRRGVAASLAPVAASLARTAFLALVLLVLALRRTAPTSPRMAALGAILIVDLFLAHHGRTPMAPAEFFKVRPPALRDVAGPAGQRVYSYDYLVEASALAHLGHRGYLLKVIREEWPGAWAGAFATRMALYPSVLGYWGIEGAYQADVLGLSSPETTWLTSYLQVQENRPLHLKLLQMGAVSRVVSLHPQPDLKLIATRDTPLIEPLLIYEVPDPVARAYAVSGARVAEGLAALRVISDSTFDLHREVVLAAGPARDADPGFQSTVSLLSLRPDRTDVEVTLNRPGYLVLVDTFDPDWRVSIDDRPASLLRANVAFQAVAIPAGAHRVQLVYRPSSLVWGAGLSVVGGALAGAFALWAARARRR